MDDLIFEREKLRRELQEMVNELDAATASEGQEQERHDLIVVAKWLALTLERPRYFDVTLRNMKERR